MIQNLPDNAPCGYFAFSDDGILMHVNETLAVLLNYKKEQLVSKNVETIFTLPTRIFFQTHFFPLVKLRGHAEEIYLTILTSEGEHLPVLLNANRTSDKNRLLTCCAFIVVPNRKKFEDELVLARKAAEKALLENSALLQAKSELASQAEQLDRQIENVKRQNNELKQFSHVVTHNLKEPLRKILLFSDKLKNEVASPTMTKLVRSADQMRNVVGGLQAYVWVNEKINQFVKVDLNDVVSKALTQISGEIDPHLLSLTMSNLHSLDGDIDQLQLLVYHLLSNAVNFRKQTPANVTITSTVLKQNKFRSMEEKYKYEDYVKLEIRDDGIGFDPIYREHIFELFRKLDISNGQGLGLALCKKIADNHNGFIEADSEINVYTRVTAWLPLHQHPTND